ncbi:MAG TPA: NAD(P)-dependent oxidoreductase [Polyangiaceae bacterium]|nr:NAD(P)-dependent oxidoreductase [Polyangiaceae bacterium]
MSERHTLRGKSLFISGATRGIGLAIACRAAREGASIAVVGKTVEPRPELPGTLDEACHEIERLGGRALPLACDIRDEAQVESAVARAVAEFGGLDVLVNNASAIFLAGTVDTPMKRFDLMHAVNVRGTYVCGQKCIPHLARSSNPHILTLAPPIDMRPEYFAPHLGYSLAKFGMSLCTLGWARELAPLGIAANCLWPRTAIDTAAVRNLLGGAELAARSRKPSIVADAAFEILSRGSREQTGQFLLDEDVLRQAGVSNFDTYAVTPGAELAADFFLPES